MIVSNFKNGTIEVQIFLVHPSKNTEEVSQPCPNALYGIDMNFSDAIVISGIFFLGMANGLVCSVHRWYILIPPPFISITGGFF